MIHYDLCCGADHRFDAWFRDSAAFDEQADAGRLSCPACGDSAVRRAVMAPNLAVARGPGRRGPETRGPETGRPETRGAGSRSFAADTLPDAARAALQRLRDHVERNSVDLGDGFADEARRIHQGRAPARDIRGHATDAQAAALREEGVRFSRIPWLPRADS